MKEEMYHPKITLKFEFFDKFAMRLSEVIHKLIAIAGTRFNNEKLRLYLGACPEILDWARQDLIVAAQQ